MDKGLVNKTKSFREETTKVIKHKNADDTTKVNRVLKSVDKLTKQD